ncbi:MAG: PAS domain S-box protein [candidate division WOR-3 bacterium]|nr:PAS domain S-box protein [candidate division WOR-3 bacterium]MCX7837695.1 PAS domain S-box protein [candidate division WOR-3 bacterium]MDW8114057.1 PAS domain S-box protein [candidate division WOR-3 bacterium]
MFEDFLNIFGNSLQFGFIYLDKEGIIKFVNKSFLSLSQLSEDNLINKNWSEIIAEEDKRWVEEFFRENKNRNFSLDFRIKRNSLPIRSFFSPIIKEKELLGYFLTFFTLEKEKELEREIALSTDIYHEIMENAIDGICILKDKKIMLVNRRLEELTGYSEEELKQINILEIISSQDKNKIVPIIEKPENIFSPVHFGIKIVHKNGFEIDTELRVVPITKNGLNSLILFLRDITYLKELEKLKTDYFAMVSHDLRSPLTTIKEATAILQEIVKDKLPKEGERFFTIIFEEIIRLFQLIDNLIEVSRLETGKIKLNFQPIDIQQLINKTIERFNIFLQKKNIKIEKNYPSYSLKVEIDPDRFSSVISNLLDNAIKYSPEKGKITILLQKIEPETKILKERKMKSNIPYLLLGINNEGPTIPKEYQEKIFEKFERIELKPGIKGIGLGLTIVKNIVKLHKGDIWIESSEEKGTTFYILIPLTQK